MKRVSTSTLAAAIMLAVASPVSAQNTATVPPAAPSVQDFAAAPVISGFTVSPDGKHIAALQARGENQVILVWDAQHLDRNPTVIGSNQMKIRGVSFVKNDVL